MQITKTYSRAELEEIAREQLKAFRGAQAPPEVRNAPALMALGEPRALRWAGHYYHVPPVPFRTAKKLMAIGEVLNGDNDPAVMDVAREHALPLLRGLVTRRSLFPAVEARVRRLRRNPFRTASTENVRDIIRFLLHVPNDNPIPAPLSADAPKAVDLVGQVAEFVQMYPAWVNAEGDPISWEHYQIGSREAPRIHARASIRFAQAMRPAQSTEEGFENWRNSVSPVAGW